ncbi:MAG TPA: AraC family transcriptional regulator [Steroidobacteraceae bacterium]|nr:AraC family transcriptional regulator [Steroidobacteraceae bacterium]
MHSSDPLSDVLSLLKVRSRLSAQLSVGGNWSLRFPSVGLKFNAVLHGNCFLLSPLSAQPVRLQSGDCLLLNQCGDYVLCSDPSLVPQDARQLFSRTASDTASYDAGQDFIAIGGDIHFEEADHELLLGALPPVLHIDEHSDAAPAMRWLLDRVQIERVREIPGSNLTVDYLTQLLFIEAVRAWLHFDAPSTHGWLRALVDRRVGAAVRLLHSDPARIWRLQELADAAGMSRSNFALRFKQLCGLAPLDYALRWRMRLGAKALRGSAQQVAAIAFSLGYQSESAFSNAFRRVTGTGPQEYRRTNRKPISSD